MSGTQSDSKRAEKHRQDRAQRERERREKHPEAVAAARRRYIENNPAKAKAHRAVGNAVYRGRLTKPEACERCGIVGLLHGHHTDYSRPLDVQWLCPLCHKGAHLDGSHREGRAPLAASVSKEEARDA